MTTVRYLFERDGFLDPTPLLTARECRDICKHLRNRRKPPPADWYKGHAVTDWLLYRLAASPRLVERLVPILGENISLWGCSVVRRKPGETHPWHVDIETSAPEGRYVTAWIGLEHTSRDSALRLIAGSHVSKTIQQIQAESGYRRGEATTETVLGWARQGNPEARLVQPNVDDGDMILFDGRIWHESHNRARRRSRTALLLQFAAADSQVRIPELNRVEWPFRFLSAPRPPAIVVRGSADCVTNRIVSPPVPPSKEIMNMLSSCIRSLDLPLAEHPDGHQPYPLFRGSTPNVAEMACHTSVLSAGHMPHLPHAHAEEELLIVIDGEAELLIADGPAVEGARVERVGPGDFVYYPAFQHHTIRNPGTAAVTYMMFKWTNASSPASENPLGVTLVRNADRPRPDASKDFSAPLIFEQATGLLGQLHCHTSRLAPGGGYDPHVDAHDVALLIQSGRVETLGEEVGPNSMIYYSAGEPHGIRNIGDEPAHYLVFEFHAYAAAVPKQGRSPFDQLARRIFRRVRAVLGEPRWLHR